MATIFPWWPCVWRRAFRGRDELLLGDDLGLDGFTTQLKNLAGQEKPIPLTTEQELDQAMAEIQAALAKYGPT
jgi:hypothetical protein